MNRICENFIEELTSRISQPSQALMEHLAGCPSCRQSAEALGLIKSARKPLSGTEASAIAATIKAVQAIGSGSSANVTPPTAVSTVSVVKYFILTAILIAGVSSAIIYSYVAGNADTTETIPQSGTNVEAVTDNKTEKPGEELTENSEPAKSTTQKTDYEVLATQTATQIKIISPDEEEVTP